VPLLKSLPPHDPLTKKFIQSLAELDQIKNPALRALAIRAIARYFGLPSLSPKLIAGSWILLILALPLGIYFLGLLKAIFAVVGLFVICSTLIGFSLMYEGHMSERGFHAFWKLCLQAMFKWPRALWEIWKARDQ
jgi:hypothetical protein